MVHRSPIAAGPARRALLRLIRFAALALVILGAASASAAAPAPGSGLGNVDTIIEQAVAASKARGLHTVDPLSLNPPAIIEYEPWFASIPYDKCWKGTTEIICVANRRTFTVGDGSLEGAGGEPLDWGIVCNAGYSLYHQFRNTWVIVRFYTLNGDIVSRYRIEIGEGTVYNSVSGSAARMSFNDLYVSTWSPPGVVENETVTIFGNDWTATTLKGKLLAKSRGVVTFFPDGSWQQSGAHPLDAYFFGDSSGIAPVCAYVK